MTIIYIDILFDNDLFFFALLNCITFNKHLSHLENDNCEDVASKKTQTFASTFYP